MENSHRPYGSYERFFKRPLDFVLSLSAIVVLSPLLVALTVIGVVAMGGNPFFVQKRPGRKDGRTGEERIFTLVKFRTMSNAKDADGRLLPDERRLNAYGRFLRSTSCDELPELLNVVRGDMAIVGPRPLLIEYLPYYTREERRRHDVRPGLTGLAQVSGRNNLGWDERLEMDLKYVDEMTFLGDLKIMARTVQSVVCRKDVVVAGHYRMKRLDQERVRQDDYQDVAGG